MALSLDPCLGPTVLFIHFISVSSLAVMFVHKRLIRSMLDDGPQSETLYDHEKDDVSYEKDGHGKIPTVYF